MNPLARILDVVDAVMVVTIQGQHQRQADTARVLNSYGVPFQFFFGADYREKTIDELMASQIYDPSWKTREQRTLLTPGEVGCAASHCALAKRVAEGEFDSLLILEDDVFVSAENTNRFEGTLQNMPANWNLLYLGYNKNNLAMPLSTRLKLHSWYPLRFMLGSQRHNPDTIRRIFRRPLDAHWFHAGCFNGTHAYAIDRAAACYIVELQTPVKLEADKALQHLVRFSGLNAYCPRFDVFDQRWDIPSLVGPRASWQ